MYTYRCINVYIYIHKHSICEIMNTPVFLGFPGGSVGKESACNAGELGLVPRLGRSSEGGHGNPLQPSCLENPHGQRSLAGCNLWGCKDSETTEWLNTQHINVYRNATIKIFSLHTYISRYIKVKKAERIRIIQLPTTSLRVRFEFSTKIGK